MLKNYFLVALRHLMKKKLYSAINILGLALGMTACILMVLFVREELSYERSFSNLDHLYRLQTTQLTTDNSQLKQATSSPKLLETLHDEVDGIAQSTYAFYWRALAEYDEKEVDVGVVWVEPAFFDMFEFRLKHGDAQAILEEPNQAIVSQKLAHYFFADEDPIGQTIVISKDVEVTIAGLLEANSGRSHIASHLFVSRSTLNNEPLMEKTSGWSTFAHTYFQTKPGANLNQIRDKLAEIPDRDMPTISRLGTTISASDYLSFDFMPVKNIHLYSDRSGEMSPPGDIALVYTFSFLSVLILIVACINFTNLATARANDRAREIGMRKLVGALRKQVVYQILGESIFLSLFSLILAIAIVEVTLPFYNDVIDRELVFKLRQRSLHAVWIVWFCCTRRFYRWTLSGRPFCRPSDPWRFLRDPLLPSKDAFSCVPFWLLCNLPYRSA